MKKQIMNIVAQIVPFVNAHTQASFVLANALRNIKLKKGNK